MSGKNKATSISLVVFGLLFIALGVFLFLVQDNAIIVMMVAGVDTLFGVALLIGGIVSGRAGDRDDGYVDDVDEEKERDYGRDERTARPDIHDERAPESDRGFRRRQNAGTQTREEPEGNDYFSDARPEPVRSELPNDPAALAAREVELRTAAKRAAEEATRLKRSATAAVQEAKEAETELSEAEARLDTLNPADRRAAMRDIDRLAQIAAAKSEVAVREAKKAKLAIRNSKNAAEEHSRAMDAAAAAMNDEDEFAEFN